MMKNLHILKLLIVSIALLISSKIKANDFSLGVNDTTYCQGDCFDLVIDEDFLAQLSDMGSIYTIEWFFNEVPQQSLNDRVSTTVCPEDSLVVRVFIDDEALSGQYESEVTFTKSGNIAMLSNNHFTTCVDSCIELTARQGGNSYAWSSIYVINSNSITVDFCADTAKGDFEVYVSTMYGDSNQCTILDTITVAVVDTCSTSVDTTDGDTTIGTYISYKESFKPTVHQNGNNLVIENYKVDQYDDVRLDIINSIGQRILSRKLNNEHSIDISTIPRGIYIVNFSMLSTSKAYKIAVK